MLRKIAFLAEIPAQKKHSFFEKILFKKHRF
jgi:hypothetical protein